MNGNWTEYNHSSIDMHEDDPETFGMYLNFLYNKTIPVPTKGCPNVHLPLAKLYVLCEKLQDIEANNYIIHAIVTTFGETFPNSMSYFPCDKSITILYEGAPDSTHVERLLVDMVVGYGKIDGNEVTT